MLHTGIGIHWYRFQHLQSPVNLWVKLTYHQVANKWKIPSRKVTNCNLDKLSMAAYDPMYKHSIRQNCTFTKPSSVIKHGLLGDFPAMFDYKYQRVSQLFFVSSFSPTYPKYISKIHQNSLWNAWIMWYHVESPCHYRVIVTVTNVQLLAANCVRAWRRVAAWFRINSPRLRAAQVPPWDPRNLKGFFLTKVLIVWGDFWICHICGGEKSWN